MRWLYLTLMLMFACAPLYTSPFPTQIPGAVNTVVAMTYAAALTETAAVLPTATYTSTDTPTATKTPLPPTDTPIPTATFIFILFTPTAPATPTREPVTKWPAWEEGTVVDMPPGSGERIGTTKMFDILKDVEVIVVRANGVKLRSIPSKAVGTKMADYETSLVLTGLMNKNSDFGWFFVKVKAPDGKFYWVGGDEGDDTNPTKCLKFAVTQN